MKENKAKKKGSIRSFIARHKKGLGLFVGAYLVVVLCVVAAPKLSLLLPYEIKVDDKTVCYVKNEESARDVIEKTYKTNLPKEAKLLRCSSNASISVDKANPFKAITNIASNEEAIECLQLASTDMAGESLELYSTYLINHDEEYIPEPIIKKDDTMLAGDERIGKKGVAGSMNVSTICTAVNGKVSNQEDIKSQITSEGTPAVVYRGTLGLPEDENWEDYTGDPVYKNGDELVVTALKYIGAPYKHGGTSLKTGVSCVGFVRAIYMKYGVKIGNSHRSMETAGIGVSYKRAMKGDIICYRGHVGIYLGNGKMIDATSKRGVGINTVHPKSIIAVRRIIVK